MTCVTFEITGNFGGPMSLEAAGFRVHKQLLVEHLLSFSLWLSDHYLLHVLEMLVGGFGRYAGASDVVLNAAPVVGLGLGEGARKVVRKPKGKGEC